MKELFELALFPVVLTLLAYQAGAALQKRLGTALCNPILVAVVIVAAFLGISGMELADYQQGMNATSWLMTPATVCLAIPMYEQCQALKKSLKAMLVGISAGALSSIVLVWGLCVLFAYPDELTVSLLPKSVTSAIGAPLAEMAGGISPVCIAVIILSGVLGSIFGELFCNLFRLTDPVAQGVAFGTASHVIGTSKADTLSPLTGAVSSLSLVIAGLLTAVILPFVFPLV